MTTWADLEDADALEVEVTARAYRYLREQPDGDMLADSMDPLQRSIFEAGVGAGCKVTAELLNELSGNLPDNRDGG